MGTDGQFYFDKTNCLYEQAQELDPQYELIYYNWGTSYCYEGRYRDALRMLQKAKRMGVKVPNDVINDFIDEIQKKIAKE